VSLNRKSWEREVALRQRALDAMKAVPQEGPIPGEKLRAAIVAIEALPPHARMAHRRVLRVFRDIEKDGQP
jgi:hypothetical protein